MTKVQTLSGQQKLRQLAKKQLGADLQAAGSVRHGTQPLPLDTSPGTASFIDKHQQLSSRAGVVLAEHEIFASLSVTERASRRIQMRQEQQQLNLEKVMTLALDYCTEILTAQDVDPDWFQAYCELVLDISSQSMQKLWAKILAGEISNPGSFSLKTLHLLKQMGYKDAIALQLAASLSCRIKSQEPAHIYFGYVQQGSLWRWLAGKNRGLLNLSQFGLTYPQILNLIDLGLLHQSEIESGELGKNQQLQWYYHQQLLQGRTRHQGVVLQYYKFTSVGAELLPLLSSQPNQQYWQALQQMLADVISFHQPG
ncbi:TIGR03899 family protein [Rheinheimera sp.]|uniref:TIGR03899 family protein n=1 Tax=Rheinheimera sp. TaxID=1869214 RepID=UPI0027B9FCE9|nr:TIGR03899 family protein [Rheinheimera sp.]